ncbi:MAG: ABC transporter ATP-binding protein, partial [Fibrobacter sp.]|nr:ABC transporter ATP-binding protein [Fibrobacter sp.]
MASVTDAAVLWGIKNFIEILSSEFSHSLWVWVFVMITLAVLRLLFLFLKIRVCERSLYQSTGWTLGWFLHRLRNLSPRVFHTQEGDRHVEAAYESILVYQSNGLVIFQAVQALLQLLVFLPVLVYISWPLTLFLFFVVLPFVGVLQKKLHGLGPVEESLLRTRSDFRNDLNLARRLFRQWSSRFERQAVSADLFERVRDIQSRGVRTGVRKSALSLLTETVSIVAMILVLAFCVLLISKGWMHSSDLVLFCSAVLLCYKPVKECTKVLPEFRSVMSAVRVLETFERLPLKSVKKSNGDLERVTVKDAAFTYQGSEQAVFEHLNMSLSKEKPVLIRGRNGAGKSTMLRLLSGLECSDTFESINEDVFFVAQDLELPPQKFLHDLLKKFETNQNGWRINAVREFMRIWRIDSIVNKERFSGGERAKIALLWAIVSNSKTLLLDEPFASIA